MLEPGRVAEKVGAVPLRREGLSRWRSFYYGQLSAWVEPIAGVIGAAAVIVMRPMLPYALAFAAGAMIFVVVEEVIPESQAGGHADIATFGAMVGFARAGAEVFDYGNNLRGEALQAGLSDAFDYPGFVPAYIRPLFCSGTGPFRFVALSGDPHDIAVADDARLGPAGHRDGSAGGRGGCAALGGRVGRITLDDPIGDLVRAARGCGGRCGSRRQRRPR